MPINITSLLLSFAGGVLGAAIGGSAAFVFTGFTVMIGFAIAAAGGGREALTEIAFGPVFGPHICFAAGAAAAAYAARIRAHPSARDIVTPLMGVDRADVLAVGGLFGIFGYLCNAALQGIGLGPWTDTIAFSVVLSGVAARYAFGRTGFLGDASAPDTRRFQPDDSHCWIRWSERPPQLVTIGLTMGLLSAYMAKLFGASGGGDAVGFGIAGALLLFLHFGHRIPVTHHIALPAATATVLTGSVIFGGIIGVLAAFVGEAYSRLFLIHGDTYVDPPAAAIATVTIALRFTDKAGWLQIIAIP